MKKFIYSIVTLAAAFAAVSCQEEIFAPGEPDLDGCYGVYFPAQDKDYTLDPDAPLSISVEVARKEKKGEITVPFVVVDSTKNQIFKAGELKFEDGQTNSKIDLTFPDLALGVKTGVVIEITDPQYASSYGVNPSIISLSFLRDKWNLLGKGTWNEQGLFEFDAPAPVEIWQNEIDKMKFRVKMKYDTDEETVYSNESDEWFNFRVLKPGEYSGEHGFAKKVSITREDMVMFDDFNTGIQQDGEDIYIVYPAGFSSQCTEELLSVSRILQYQENGLPAGVQIGYYGYLYKSGGGAGFNVDGALVITFPGVVLTDYSLSVESAFSDNGVLPLTFTAGTDVNKIVYKVYEGTLNSAQKIKYADEIGAGTAEDTEEVPDNGKVAFSTAKTGVYTVVAVSFDADGNPQQSATAEFSYVAANDAVPVEAMLGMNATGKYGPGYSSDETLEFWMYGKNITDLKFDIFEAEDLMGVNNQTLYAYFAEMPSESAEVLEAVNNGTYVDIITGAIPGTDYVLVAWMSNGFEEDLFVATAKTTGKVEVTLEDMIGTYDVSPIFYDRDPEPDEDFTTIIAESDTPANGNVMFTAFAGYTCETPIYATVDITKNTITIPINQKVCTVKVANGAYDLYLTDGSTGKSPIVFRIKGEGKFGNPKGIVELAAYVGNNYAGYWDLFTGFNAVMVADAEAPKVAPASISRSKPVVAKMDLKKYPVALAR